VGPRKNKVWVTGTEEHGEHGFNTTKKACPTAKIISPKLDTNTLYPPLNLPHPAASPRPDLSLRYKSSFRKVRTRVRAALGGNFSNWIVTGDTAHFSLRWFPFSLVSQRKQLKLETKAASEHGLHRHPYKTKNLSCAIISHPLSATDSQSLTDNGCTLGHPKSKLGTIELQMHDIFRRSAPLCDAIPLLSPVIDHPHFNLF